MHRYAIYFAPCRSHPLWNAGCRLLGRDPETGEDLPQPVLAGLAPERLSAITAEPRRYGWHATLKPPFALAPGTDRPALEKALDAFAASRQAFAMPPLMVASLSGFLALLPACPSPALDALAADCVQRFDRFRSPPAPEELARRRSRPLDPVEERNLALWGYPYVMDRFRFHMTLTARLEADERHTVGALLARHLADALAVPLVADAIALFGEPAPGAPFALLRRFPLAG